MNTKQFLALSVVSFCPVLFCPGQVWVDFSAPTVEHVNYYFSTEAGFRDEITLLVREGGSDTIIGYAAHPGSISGTHRVEISEEPIEFVLQTVSGTNHHESVVHAVSPSSVIAGTAKFDETITLSESAMSSGFSASEGITVTLSDGGSVTWSNASFGGKGTIVVQGAGFPSLWVSAGSFGMSGCLVEESARFDGGTAVISDCLFNGRAPYVNSLDIRVTNRFEMSGSEVAGELGVNSAGTCVFSENTFYDQINVSTVVGLSSGAVTFSRNTFLQSVYVGSDDRAFLNLDNNYYGAPASNRDTVHGWLNPWHLEKDIPCLDDGDIERCSRMEPRNVELFRSVVMAAGQSVMSEQSSSADNDFYPESFSGKIRVGRPFAMSFDLQSCAEELPGVSYQLVYKGSTYRPAGSFTAKARREPDNRKNNADLTLNFILPAPSAVSTNNEWELFADFSSCSANIVKPVPARISVARGGIPIQPGFARPLRIGVVEINLQDGSTVSNCSPSARSEAVTRLENDLQSKLALLDSEVEIIDLGYYTFSGGWISSWISQTDIGRANQLSSELEWFVGNYNDAVSDPLDFVVGVAPVNALGGADGLSMALRRSAVLVDEFSPDAALHEIGHSMGLYTGTEQYNCSYGYTGGGYLSPGRGLDLAAMSAFNGSGRSGKAVESGKIRHFPACMHNSVYDVMGAKNPQWIGQGTFHEMQTWLESHLGLNEAAFAAAPVESAAAEALAEASEDGPSDRVVHVGAIFSRLPDGDTVLTSSVRLEEIAGGGASGGGVYNLPYQFRTYDAGGFPLSYAQCTTDVSGYITNSFWQQTFSVPAEAAEYQLVYTTSLNGLGGTPVWTRYAGTALTNSLQVTYNSESDAYALNWSFSGSIRTVENRLLISEDSGSTWTPRPLPVYTNAIIIPRAGLSVENPQFKLLSSDGMQSVLTEAVSGLPAVALAPSVRITGPLSGAQSITGTVWHLSADVSDANGDLLSVEWFSSIDGLLGSGLSLETELSEGAHQLSAVATDGTGLAATGLVSVTVSSNLTSVDLSLSAGDLTVSPVANGYGLNTVGYGMTNSLDVVFRNQGVSNAVQIQVYLTRPDESESALYDDTWDMSPFDARALSLEFDAPSRGTYQVRAVCTPLDIPDADTNNNQIIAVYTNLPPQVFANRLSVMAADLPLSVPLAAQDPNGDAVTFELAPESGASLSGDNVLVFDNGGAAGSYPVQFTASDSESTSVPATVVIDVYGAELPVITSASSFSATSGVPVSILIAADNGPCTFNSTNLPSGLSLNENSGEITGQIDSDGTYVFSVTAQNAVGSDTEQITLTVSASAAVANDNFEDAAQLTGSPVVISGSTVGATLESGEPDHAGFPGSASVWWRWTAPSNGVAGIEWSGSFVMVGIYTGSSVGALTGQGSSAGFNSLACFNAVAGQEYFIALGSFSDETLTLNLGYHRKPVLRSPLRITAVQNSPVDVAFATWNTASGFSATELPDGLTLDPASGRLSGSPTGYGNFYPQITVTNAYGSSTALVSIEIRSTNAPCIISPLYAAATLGESFSYTLQTRNASDGTLTADFLPDGLLFDSDTGVISGTPLESGLFSVSLGAANTATSEYVSEQMTLLVRTSYALWLEDCGFTSEQQGNAAVSGPDADPDGDGATNREEFVAGTDPLDSADVLKVRLTRRSGQVSVEWPGKNNRRYIIQKSGNLTGGFSSVSNNVLPTPPTNTVNMMDTGSAGFYRIQVQE